MNKYHAFIFKDYIFDKKRGKLELFYSYDNALHFQESYHFDFEFVDYNEAVLQRALELLFFVAGVSYYKAFLAQKILIEKGAMDEQTASFLGQTYEKGLGEFFYVNHLNPRTPVIFPTNTAELTQLALPPTTGLLVGIGGGKDSLVSVEILRKSNPALTTWSLNHRPQLTQLVERVGTPHLWVDRDWDQQLLALKENPDAYNGHVPISAIFACVGTVVAILSGKRDIVVSNESSANEPTLHYQDIAINHQYSKSLEFEKAYQAELYHSFGDGVRFFSFLRPLSEVRIAELFAGLGFEKYKDGFSSCNRAFVHGSREMTWDGTCPKCAFVFLALTPFVKRPELETLFHGKNLLLDPALEPMYRQLLGIKSDKPLECVGEVKESRAAMRLAQNIYPELVRYQFELPDDYDFRAWSEQSMPAEFFNVLQKQTN